MRAGADGWWGDDVESIVRAAAGSACVKARSDRYLAAEGKPRSPAPETSVSAPRAETVRSAEVVAAPAASAVQDSADADADGDADADSDSWSVGGMTFRSLSGSPGAKPYERQRKKAGSSDDESEGESGGESGGKSNDER
jgi:hypothetical protein